MTISLILSTLQIISHLVRHKSTKGMSDNQHYYNIQGSLNKFLDFFRLGTFIDSTHMKL